jgi:hypothetical protein
VTEREKTLIDALLEDHKEEGPPTEFTATIAPGMCAKIDEPGVMDSGANVSVTNPHTVDKFNLVPQRWERPFHIIFGNGARFHCTQVIFHSSNLALNDKDEMTSVSPKGTIGFKMFPDVPTQETVGPEQLPTPPPLKGHLHMFERVTRAKSKLALSVRASLPPGSTTH